MQSEPKFSMHCAVLGLLMPFAGARYGQSQLPQTDVDGRRVVNDLSLTARPSVAIDGASVHELSGGITADHHSDRS